MASTTKSTRPAAARSTEKKAAPTGAPRRVAANSDVHKRLNDIGLKLGQVRDVAQLSRLLVRAAKGLLKARRVLLAFDAPGGPVSAGAALPRGEEAPALLAAIRPWLDEARATRAARLRHGPEGAPPDEQRSCLVAPLVVEQRVLGYLYADVDGSHGRLERADQDVLGMLAAQAAVALDRAQQAEALVHKVETRSRELADALERQTATAEILKVISGSPTDAQPVFDAIVTSAAQLFGRTANLWILVKEDRLQLRASSAGPRYQARDGVRAVNRDSTIGKVVLDRTAIQITNTSGPDSTLYARANAQRLGFRATAAAPFIGDNKVVGVLSVTAPEPGGLSDNQMALLQTFADQAEIGRAHV